MMLGRECVLPLELVTGVGLVNRRPLPASEHVVALSQRLKEVHNLARKTLGVTLNNQKRTYDIKLYQKPYELGDLVYKLDTSTKVGESKKLRPVYTGPLVVSKVISPILYQVEARKKSFVLHHDRLRKCSDRDIPLWLRRRRHQVLNLEIPLPPVDEDDIDLSLLDLAEQTMLNLPVLAYPDSDDDQDQALPLDLSVGGNAAAPDPDPDLGLNLLFDDDTVDTQLSDSPFIPFSRAGRHRRRPAHLQDYSVEYDV